MVFIERYENSMNIKVEAEKVEASKIVKGLTNQSFQRDLGLILEAEV